MPNMTNSAFAQIFEKHRDWLLDNWLQQQRTAGSGINDDEAQLRDYSTRFIAAMRQGVSSGRVEDVSSAPEWSQAREVLGEFSRNRAQKGATPTQTATFVFSLKQPLFDLLRREFGRDAESLARETWIVSLLLDQFGLYTTEVFQKDRESIIIRQQEELLELSTPVVQLWSGILALPLIGTLDSARTQVVMENLLQAIVSQSAEIAIIDITGVPTVDTLVAQHLLKTISAARLMGADCIISGIRPQIAQTIVHLGLDLNVISKATMAEAFGLALRRTGRMIVERGKPTGETAAG